MNEHDLRAADIVRNALEVRRPRNGHNPGRPDPIAVAAGAVALEQHVAKAQKDAEAQRRDEAALQAAVGDRVQQLQLILLRGLLAERGATATVAELEESGALQGFADGAGNRWFELRGQVLVTFYPPEAAIDAEAGLLVNLRMRVPT